jgi:hypothetical protein
MLCQLKSGAVNAARTSRLPVPPVRMGLYRLHVFNNTLIERIGKLYF